MKLSNPVASRFTKAFFNLRIVLPLGLICGAAQASSFDALYAFGDSLTDTGNVFALTGGIEPAAPYYEGRFSNGPNWIDTLASNLGLSIDPYENGGTNYAFGGAVTGPSLSSAPIPSLLSQVALYNSANGSAADPNALYVIWGGANDVLDGGNPSATSMSKAVTNVESVLNTLASEGAKNFLVGNLPNVGLTPQAIAGGTALQMKDASLSALFNNQLAATLPGLAASDSVHITELDVYDFLNNLIDNAGSYGFTNTTSSCYSGPYTGGGTSCADPNQYLFWDGLHPTTAADALLGDYATSAVPLPTAGWLLFSALGALGVWSRPGKPHAKSP